MLLGFKRHFAPFVENGTKTHTIRVKRKTPPKTGEICHCYVDPRQKTMRLLGRWPCIQVEDVRIDTRGTFEISGCALDEYERNVLAWRDGFRPDGSSQSDPGQAFELMLKFFGNRLPFHGDIIHWDFTRPK